MYYNHKTGIKFATFEIPLPWLSCDCSMILVLHRKLDHSQNEASVFNSI